MQNVYIKNSTEVISRKIFGTQSNEIITGEIQKFETQPGRVSITLSHTIPIRPYETCTVSVSVTVPCYVEDIDITASNTMDYISKKLQQYTNQILEQLTGQKNER